MRASKRAPAAHAQVARYGTLPEYEGDASGAISSQPAAHEAGQRKQVKCCSAAGGDR